MELHDTTKDLFQLLSDQLLVSTGTELARDLRKVLSLAQQDAAWRDLNDIKRANLSFQVEQLCGFLTELDHHTERVHMKEMEGSTLNPKQLRYA